MAKKAEARAVLFERIRNSAPKFVHVAGVPYVVELSNAENPAEAEQVWITVEAAPFGKLRVALNTVSTLSKAHGVDPRIVVATIPSPWTEKPASGLTEMEGMSYAAAELAGPLDFQPQEQEALTNLLHERAKQAVRLEAWGELCAGENLGVRQIHSRSASSAVRTSVKGRDGALRLYYADGAGETFFFKFHGQ